MASSLLIYSPKCKHSMNILQFINTHEEIKPLVSYHNINEYGVPDQYKKQIRSVPTLLTSNGKILVGSEIIQWFSSLLPAEIENCQLGTCSAFACSIEDETGYDNLFSLDSYGQSLQGLITDDLKAKITQNVSEAYQLKEK
jgi:hypothetical protein